MSLSQEMISSSLSTCDLRSYPHYMNDRLIEKELDNDTLRLNVGLIMNCCNEIETSLNYKRDTLFLTLTDTSSMDCACDCCFELRIDALGITDTSFTLVYQLEDKVLVGANKVETRKTSKTLNKNISKYIFPGLEHMDRFHAINRKNDEGQRIGLWEDYYSDTTTIKYKTLYAFKSKGASETVWRISYDKKGEITEVCAVNKRGNMTCITNREYFRIMKGRP